MICNDHTLLLWKKIGMMRSTMTQLSFYPVSLDIAEAQHKLRNLGVKTHTRNKATSNKGRRLRT